MKSIIIEAEREGYTTGQCGETLTVGELIEQLQEYDKDAKVYLSHDNGYTYGSIKYGNFRDGDDEMNESGIKEKVADVARCLEGDCGCR